MTFVPTPQASQRAPATPHRTVWLRPPTVAQVVLLAAAQIEVDIVNGIVPATVGSFSELHDYVDANMYGDPDLEVFGLGTHEGREDLPAIAFVAEVQDVVDAWLRAGRPPLDPPGCDDAVWTFQGARAGALGVTALTFTGPGAEARCRAEMADKVAPQAGEWEWWEVVCDGVVVESGGAR
jgi:hypothetical protein